MQGPKWEDLHDKTQISCSRLKLFDAKISGKKRVKTQVHLDPAGASRRSGRSQRSSANQCELGTELWNHVSDIKKIDLHRSSRMVWVRMNIDMSFIWAPPYWQRFYRYRYLPKNSTARDVLNLGFTFGWPSSLDLRPSESLEGAVKAKEGSPLLATQTSRAWGLRIRKCHVTLEDPPRVSVDLWAGC
jgi:hypothetical protein